MKLEKKLIRLIKKFDLEKYESEILSLSKKTIIFIKDKKDDYSEIGNTRFGGYPDVINKFLWPKNKEGKYYTFLCQINLNELSKYESKLPKKGTLYFFYGSNLNTNAKYSSKNKVNLKKHNEIKIDEFFEEYENEPYRVISKQILTLPEKILEIFEKSKLNEVEDINFYVKYNELKDKLDRINGSYLASMLGYLPIFEYEIRDHSYSYEQKFKNEPIILYLSSDFDIGFCFNDYGILALRIKEIDLNKKKFSSVLLSGCSS